MCENEKRCKYEWIVVAAGCSLSCALDNRVVRFAVCVCEGAQAFGSFFPYATSAPLGDGCEDLCLGVPEGPIPGKYDD